MYCDGSPIVCTRCGGTGLHDPTDELAHHVDLAHDDAREPF